MFVDIQLEFGPCLCSKGGFDFCSTRKPTQSRVTNLRRTLVGICYSNAGHLGENKEEDNGLFGGLWLLFLATHADACPNRVQVMIQNYGIRTPWWAGELIVKQEKASVSNYYFAPSCKENMVVKILVLLFHTVIDLLLPFFLVHEPDTHVQSTWLSVIHKTSHCHRLDAICTAVQVWVMCVYSNLREILD